MMSKTAARYCLTQIRNAAAAARNGRDMLDPNYRSYDGSALTPAQRYSIARATLIDLAEIERQLAVLRPDIEALQAAALEEYRAARSVQ